MRTHPHILTGEHRHARTVSIRVVQFGVRPKVRVRKLSRILTNPKNAVRDRRIKKKIVDVTSNFWAGALKGPPTPPTPRILLSLGLKGHQSAPFQILHPSASKGNTINVSVRRCESKTDSEHPYACLH